MSDVDLEFQSGVSAKRVHARIGQVEARLDRVKSLMDSWEAAVGKELAQEIVAIIKDYVERVVAPLKQRIAELEARGEVRMRGIWLDGEEYQKGNLVIYNGGLWDALERTKSRPGSDSTFRLNVKQGQFSR